jgi:hypothetical protein
MCATFELTHGLRRSTLLFGAGVAFPGKPGEEALKLVWETSLVSTLALRA